MSVYTSVSTVELEQFLLRYNIGKLVDFTGITAGMENTNYFLDTTKGRYVLTLYEAYNKEELPFFLGLMQHLSAHKVETIKPVFDREGQLLQHLCGKPAAIIERLEGDALKQSEVSVEHCSLIGNALARFHLAGKSYSLQRDNEDRRYYLSPKITEPLLLFLSDKDQQLLKQELDFHQTIKWDELPSGITHSDLFCDNSVFYSVDNKPVLSGIIDLYLSCYDAFIYDLAIIANDWCCDSNHHLDQERWLAVLSAYDQIRPLDTIEKQAWVAMLRSAALRFWISRLDNKLNPPEGEMVLCKSPDDYKLKLQACLEDQEEIMQAIDTFS